MTDRRGQISLEYLMIFAVSLIVLIAFTLPLTQYGIETTMDVSDSLKLKSDLSKLSSAIEQVYGQGQGARQSVNIQLTKAIKININDHKISADLKLKGGSKKLVDVDCKSNLKYSSLSLKKGSNRIVVEWPVGSENMEIY